MPAETYTLSAPATTGANGGTVSVGIDAALGSVDDATRVPRAMPASIPREQAYYWSLRWQEAEARGLADLESGRFRTFDDPQDAIRHLLGGDR